MLTSSLGGAKHFSTDHTGFSLPSRKHRAMAWAPRGWAELGADAPVPQTPICGGFSLRRTLVTGAGLCPPRRRHTHMRAPPSSPCPPRPILHTTGLTPRSQLRLDTRHEANRCQGMTATLAWQRRHHQLSGTYATHSTC